MAVQKKRGRNGYLHDFEKNKEGGYVYTGALWQADSAKRKGALIKLWPFCAGQFLAAVLPGFFTTAGFSGSFYVILPYAFWLIMDGYEIYLLGRITFGGNPMRGYVYERSVPRLTPCAGAAAFGAALTAWGLFAFFIKGGTGQGGLLCFACCLFQGISFIFLKKWNISDLYKKI